MILADKIIDLRKKNGWSQEELAEKLGVSRQAVSKWESAQAIPDLGRVLAMADLFSVTTDYLLRDENEAPTPAAVEDGASESSVRRVSMEEASAFLALCRKQAPTRALAVSLCVLSPIPLLMILSRTGEGPAAGVGSIIGVVILLLLVVAAVVIFLRQGMESKEYEYLEQEDIETAYGVSGMVKEKQAAYRETCTRGIIVGVVLCILSAIPVLLGTLAADSVAAPERIMLPCVSLLLAMVAVAVYLFVCVGMVQGSFQRLLEEGDYTREGKRAARSPIVPIYWCLVTAAYLAWSFITMAWDRTWIVWPVAGVLFAAVVGIIRMTHKEGRKEKKAGKKTCLGNATKPDSPKRVKGQCPLRGQGAELPCGVWGNAPTVPRATNSKRKVHKGAGSEASLPVTLRSRRSAPQLAFPIPCTLPRQMGATEQLVFPT